MGGKLGTIFARAGHEVVFSYARSKAKLERLAREAGARARAGTPRDAAHDADAVLLAVHGQAAADAPLIAAARENDTTAVRALLAKRADPNVPAGDGSTALLWAAYHSNLDMARAVVRNSKLRRTGVCGAAETLLVDAQCVGTHLAPIVRDLLDAGCEVRGDSTVMKVDPRVRPATEEDWRTEYLDAVIAARVVDGVDAAIEHITKYGSAHTESIVTADSAAAERFLSRVDSAIVLHNASTQFADGGEFGMGAEIGISTDRFHARGPVGVEQLTSYKYVVRGSGQVRP